MTLIITQNTHVKVQKKRSKGKTYFLYFLKLNAYFYHVQIMEKQKKNNFYPVGANKIFTVKGIVKSRKIFLSIVLNFLTLEVKHYFYCVKE